MHLPVYLCIYWCTCVLTGVLEAGLVAVFVQIIVPIVGDRGVSVARAVAIPAIESSTMHRTRYLNSTGACWVNKGSVPDRDRSTFSSEAL